MSEQQNTNSIPTWFWVISAIALIWNIMGIGAFIQQMSLTPEGLAAMSEAQQELYTSTPSWVNWAFALSVFGGAFGCLLLILKKASAKYLLILSFIGVMIQMGYVFLISKAIEGFGPGGAIMPVMIIIIAAALIWLSIAAKNKGWIR
jgi:hypothetical protein